VDEAERRPWQVVFCSLVGAKWEEGMNLMMGMTDCELAMLTEKL